MSSGDTLLDAFVNISVRGADEAEAQIAEFVGKVKSAFGKSAAATVKVKPVADQAAAVESARSAAKQATDTFRDAVLKFQQEKFEFQYQIRLLNDRDISRQFQDIQSEVSAAQKQFALAEPGEAGDADRAQALGRVNAARQQGLALLRQQTEAELANRGLDAIYAKKQAALTAAGKAAVFFKDNLQAVKKVISSLGDDTLSKDFEDLATRYRDAERKFREAASKGSIIDAKAAVKAMQQIDKELRNLKAGASSQLRINTNITDILSKAKSDIKLFNAQMIELRQISLGSLSGLEKANLAKLMSQLQIVILEMETLGKKTNATAAELGRMIDLDQEFARTAQGIKEIYEGARQAGSSFNSLNNSAYQLGQAFEDAAIGFELNGIAGAVRGASNNVSFLLNNIVNSEAAVKRFGKATAANLAVFTGIGAAIAVVLLPRLAEWLAALNDIESSARDVSERFREAIEDIRLVIDLQIDQEAEVQAIRDAKDILDAIDQLIESTEKQREIQLKVTGTLAGFRNSPEFQEITKSAKELQDAINAQLGESAGAAAFLANPIVEALQAITRSAGATALGTDFAKLLNFDSVAEFFVGSSEGFEELEQAVTRFRLAQSQAISDAERGVVNTDALVEAEDSLTQIVDEYQKIVDSGNLSAEAAQILKANIDAARNSMRDLRQEAEALEAAQQAQIEAAKELIRQVQNNAFQLPDDLAFEAQVQAGRRQDTPVDRLIFDLERAEQKAEEAARKIKESLLAAGATPEVADAAAAALLIQSARERELQLAQEIRDIDQERIEAEQDAAQLQIDNRIRMAEIAQDENDANVEAMDEMIRLQEKQDEDLKKAEDRRQKAAKNLQEAEAAVEEEKRNAELDRLERSLQEQIQARQKLSQTQIDQFAIGTLEKTSLGESVDPILEALKIQLSNLQFERRREADAARLQALEERVIEARKALLDADDALLKEKESQQEEIEKLNQKHAAELRKIQEQLETEREKQQEQLKKNTEATLELEKAMKALLKASGEAQQDQADNFIDLFRAPAEVIIQGAGVAPQFDGPVFRPEEPVFAPEDAVAMRDMFGFDSADMIRAQGQANAAAMESTDFSSSSMEALLTRSNTLMTGLQDIMRGIDVSARYTA